MIHHSLALLLGAGLCAQATTVTVPCSRDNTLYESATGALSGGAGQGLFVGRTGQATDSIRRAVMRFDLATLVPTGARITAATLTINSAQSTAAGIVPVSAHRLLQDWGEGTTVPTGGLGGGGAGGPATVNSATWLHTFFSTSLWTTPGGSFAPTASFVLQTQPIGLASSSPTAAMLADIQNWANNPAQNFGWLLKTDEATASVSRRIDSREATAGAPPVLVVTYLLNGQTTSIGQGCPVAGQPFTVSWAGAPIGGNSVQLVQSNGPANNLAANILSLSYDPAGFPLVPGCLAYLPVNGLLVTHSLIFLSATGTGTATLNIPPGFPGVMFTSQTAALQASSPTGYVLTNVAIALLQ